MQGRSHRPQHDSRVFKRAMNEQGNALLNLSGKASGGRARSILKPAKPYKRTLPPPAGGLAPKASLTALRSLLIFRRGLKLFDRERNNNNNYAVRATSGASHR